MTRRSRSLVLALVGLAGLVMLQPATAEGRADWQGYAWQFFAITACQPNGAVLACPPYHQKWDWKRNQWVDMAITIDPAAGQLRLTQRLTNRDTHDDDDVCVTMLVLDHDGHTLLAHHQNWHSVHGAVMQDDFTLRAATLARAASVHIGSKQCRQGPHQDDAVYAQVRAGLPS